MIKKKLLISVIIFIILIGATIIYFVLTTPPAELSIGRVFVHSSFLNSSTFSGIVISTYNLTFDIPINNTGGKDALNFTTSIRMSGREVIRINTEKLSSGESRIIYGELSNFTTSNLGQALFRTPNPSYTATIYIDSTQRVLEINETNNAIQLQFNL